MTEKVGQDRNTGWSRHLVWLPPALLFAAVAAITVWLLALGSRGSEVAGVLSLAVAVLALAPNIARPVRGATRKAARQWKPGHALLGLAGILVLGVGCAFVIWFFGGQSDVNVTSDVTVPGGERMGNGSEVSVRIGDRLAPPERDNLAVTVNLTNPAKTGDCVGPARLAVSVAIDGEPPRLEHTVRPGEEAVLDLSAATRKAEVRVVLLEPDPACEVALSVDRALLYN